MPSRLVGSALLEHERIHVADSDRTEGDGAKLHAPGTAFAVGRAHAGVELVAGKDQPECARVFVTQGDHRGAGIDHRGDRPGIHFDFRYVVATAIGRRHDAP